MSQVVLTKFKSSPSFSFRGKFNSLTTSNNPEHLPSPSQYSPEKPYKNLAKIAFTKSIRKTFLDTSLQKSPGPGQYQINLSQDHSYHSLGKQNKSKNFAQRFALKRQQKPGPGAYQIKNDFKKALPSFSMSKKTQTFHQINLKRDSFKQAPGAYDVQPKLSRTSSFISIPKSPRMTAKKDTLPGPGKYETNQNFYSQRSFGKRNFSISERKISFDMKNASPGRNYILKQAGMYIPESTFQKNKRKQKGFSCRKKLIDIIKANNVPGPGEYETKSEISFRSTESAKIPHAQRKTLSHIIGSNLQTPGPGNYQNPSQTYSKLMFKSQSAPKFSKAKLQKISSIKKDTTDKFYDPKINLVKRSSSSFSIGAEKRKHIFDKILKLPGPGEYNHHQVKIVNESVMAPKFPKSLRASPILTKLPVGPGDYFNPQASSSFSKMGAKFSKGERKTDFSHIQNQRKSLIRMSNLTSNSHHQVPLIKR